MAITRPFTETPVIRDAMIARRSENTRNYEAIEERVGKDARDAVAAVISYIDNSGKATDALRRFRAIAEGGDADRVIWTACEVINIADSQTLGKIKLIGALLNLVRNNPVETMKRVDDEMLRPDRSIAIALLELKSEARVL